MGVRGFTLIELIVSLAVVGVLVAIVVPVIGRARAEGVRLRCHANLRSLGGAVNGVVNDTGRLPIAPLWVNLPRGERRLLDALAPYLDAPTPRIEEGRVVTPPPFACPGDDQIAPVLGVSYAYVAGGMMGNMGFSREPSARMVGYVQSLYETHPSDLTLMEDGGLWHPDPSGINTVYFDGHVGVKKSRWRRLPRDVREPDSLPSPIGR